MAVVCQVLAGVAVILSENYSEGEVETKKITERAKMSLLQLRCINGNFEFEYAP
mgnify:CR=1 FL=1